MKRNSHSLKRVFCSFLTIVCLISSAASAQNVDNMSAEELAAYIVSLARMLEEKQNETVTPVAEKSSADNDYSVEFNHKTYIGTYVGDTENNTPHGEGRFEGTFNSKKLFYEGTWKDGQFAGHGNLECEDYTLHFDNSEGAFDRIGPFKGKVVNGVPDGQGTFSSVNSEGVSWTYTGEWANGLFHGHGRSIWDDSSAINQVGTYIKGNFSPTLSEALISLSSNANFSVSEKSKSFINDHPEYFHSETQNSAPHWSPSISIIDGSILPSTYMHRTHTHAASIKNVHIQKNFDLKQFKKISSPYDHKLLHVPKAHVIQVQSLELGASTFEQILFETDDDTTYYGFLQGSSSIVEDMQIEAYVLPLDYATYESVSGDEIWAIFCAIASNIQEVYDTLKQGSSGSDVLNMKYRMQDLGYFNADASLSDSYNNTCVERVKQFQSINNLPVTGIADHATLSLLYSDRAKPKP